MRKFLTLAGVAAIATGCLVAAAPAHAACAYEYVCNAWGCQYVWWCF
jgi:hypothetical protein